ncbi:hypothetical protein SELMODRAFT_97989 [Selaginella moellendorffii]|uniref:heme oxygenase (biliverdin-producing) n=2 Tax=Selaginella moellendorffii TaxID=88036 RepID=D8RPQ1_SELML|nr:hypothetical protein SELMODRAFT_97989 [Selaginella moellendorffii]
MAGRNQSSSGIRVFASTTLSESPELRPKRPGERKGFVEEMRFVAMKLHTKDQAKEGGKEADVQPVGSWKPTIQGYLQFLVDNKLIYEVLEALVRRASHSFYTEFQDTGLERSEALAKDLEWFQEQGHELPEPSLDGKSYAEFLETIAEEDPPAFICHFYNYYFAHTAGGRFIGKKVADEILDGRELEFYKWKGELPKLLNAVRDKINRISEEWSREDKDRCLKETAKSFKYSGKILRKIISS